MGVRVHGKIKGKGIPITVSWLFMDVLDGYIPHVTNEAKKALEMWISLN